MPTNIRRRSRTRRDIPDLDETVITCLLYGTAEPDTPGWSLYISRFFGNERLLAAWHKHKAALLKETPDPWVLDYLKRKGVLSFE